MKVRTEVQVYELNGNEANGKNIAIENDWISATRVILVVGKYRYLVSAANLRRAIDNATNHS